MRSLLFALLLLGCGDTDCPDSITPGSSCSSPGLSCQISMEVGCDCRSGKWECNGGPPDLAQPIEHD